MGRGMGEVCGRVLGCGAPTHFLPSPFPISPLTSPTPNTLSYTSFHTSPLPSPTPQHIFLLSSLFLSPSQSVAKLPCDEPSQSVAKLPCDEVTMWQSYWQPFSQHKNQNFVLVLYAKNYSLPSPDADMSCLIEIELYCSH